MTHSLAMAGDGIDIIIPLVIKSDPAAMDESIRSTIALHQKAGFDTFMLTGPTKGWRSVGYPPIEHFEQIAADILRFKQGLRGHDIRLGWWNTLTLKTGPGEYQRIVNIGGEAVPTSTCPLDEGYRERFSNDVALVARLAEPVLIVFEDDFGLNCHRGHACFCDLHLRAFAERVGRFYSREELRRLFAEDTSPEAIPLRLEWAAMSRDSLAGLAARTRQAVDRETPWMPMGSMQPGCADLDGDTTEAVARAFAGPNHRPFVRLFGTSYCSDDAFALPKNIFHALYFKQHMSEDVICYHESDTYPHTRFFMSAGKMRSLMGAGYSYGFAGSTFQACQYLDDMNEEVGYHEAFMQERSRFQVARNLARQCEVSGCGLLFDPLVACRDPKYGYSDANPWVSTFGHFGIPFTTLESPVNALAGNQAKGLTDEQLRALLAKGLILDGEAAATLCERGFSEAIGVSVTGKEDITKPFRDLEGRERIREDFIHTPTGGREMMWYSTFSPYGNGELYHLRTNGPDTEIVTDVLDFRDQIIGVGMSRFQNALGGRVVVMAMSVRNNMSSSLFNYRRGRLMQELVLWAGADEIVYVRERPKTFCILNRPRPDCEDKSLVAFLTLINLCSDTFDFVELYLPRPWRESTILTCLDIDGQWQSVPHSFQGETLRIEHSLPLYQPLYLRLRKG